jgi:16S rRNA (uracil1498-N3)-methyltransferase
MQLYFSPDVNADELILDKDEAHHLVHVVRIENGEEILLTDGKGVLAKAEVLKASAKDCRVRILERKIIPAPEQVLHLVFAPTKNIDRTEWMLEKATEMGVQVLTPLRSRYSERNDLNMERVQKIIIAAAKQSQRAWFPELNPLITFSDFVQQVNGNAFIAHCNVNHSRGGWNTYLEAGFPSTVLIGPEGDFSEEEIIEANEAGIKGLDLGNRRLRTETAAMAVCFPLLLK